MSRCPAKASDFRPRRPLFSSMTLWIAERKRRRRDPTAREKTTRPSAKMNKESAGPPSSTILSPCPNRTSRITRDRGVRLRPTFRLRKSGTVCSVRTTQIRCSSSNTTPQSCRSASRSCSNRLVSRASAVSTATRSPTSADSSKHAPACSSVSDENRDDVHRTRPESRTRQAPPAAPPRGMPSWHRVV
eukprot:scaffold34921_cov236-Isochrysis_galbana.AAC.11